MSFSPEKKKAYVKHNPGKFAAVDDDSELEQVLLKLNTMIDKSNQIDEKLSKLEKERRNIKSSRKPKSIPKKEPIKIPSGSPIRNNNSSSFNFLEKSLSSHSKSRNYYNVDSSFSNSFQSFPSKHSSNNIPRPKKFSTDYNSNPNQELTNSTEILLQLLDSVNSLREEVAQIARSQEEMKKAIYRLQLHNL